MICGDSVLKLEQALFFKEFVPLLALLTGLLGNSGLYYKCYPGGRERKVKHCLASCFAPGSPAEVAQHFQLPSGHGGLLFKGLLIRDLNISVRLLWDKNNRPNNHNNNWIERISVLLARLQAVFQSSVKVETRTRLVSNCCFKKKCLREPQVTARNLLRDMEQDLPPEDRRLEQLFPLRGPGLGATWCALSGTTLRFVGLITNSRTSNPLPLDKWPPSSDEVQLGLHQTMPFHPRCFIWM